jgi:crotonobetainyl-CoA:carnitine CoA-transferase CaiB-like acyl-CoA transferase
MKLLEGVKVLELGTTLTAPFAAMLLADLGADVLKVENPDGGDHFRSFRGGLYSPHFTAYNKNKRSIRLDIRSDDGRAKLWQLIERADVLVDNFRPGALQRLGLHWDALHARNPRLIHCSITGFGATGPYRDRPSYDTVGSAVGGILGLFLDPEDPQIVGPTLSDNSGGMFAAQGILAALYERTRSNVGRRVEINMVEAVMAFVPDQFAMLTQGGISSDRLTRVRASQAFTFRCADGKGLAIHLSSPEKFWQNFVRALACDDIAADPRFSTRMARFDHYLELRDALKALIATRPRAHWTARLEECDVPYAPINRIDETLTDPHLQALGTFYTVAHPTEGPVTSIRRPILVDGTRAVDDLPPPTLGEHDAAIFGPAGVTW